MVKRAVFQVGQSLRRALVQSGEVAEYFSARFRFALPHMRSGSLQVAEI